MRREIRGIFALYYGLEIVQEKLFQGDEKIVFVCFPFEEKV